MRELVPQSIDPDGITGQLLELEHILAQSREPVLTAATLSDLERGLLQTTLGRALEDSEAVLDLVRGAVALRERCTGPLLACAANPWAAFGGIEEAVAGRTPPPALSVRAFKNEKESAALNLFNFGNAPRTLRVELGAFTAEGGEESVPARDVIALCEVTAVPTQTMDMSSDALPLVNQANTLTLPAWAARQLWFTLDTASLDPGDWSCSIRLRTLEPESFELTATLDLTVWNAAMPEKHPLRLCHWGYVHSSYLRDQPDAALEDQVAHGTSVFVGLFPPQATYDENGELVGDVDFTAHDAYVRRHAPHGIILFCGYQGGVKGPGGFGSPAYNKAHVAYLRAWVAHLVELGVAYDGFALYPVDEMGLRPGLVEHYLACAKLAREADPNILMYSDPAPGVTVAELEESRPYVDIWCPSTGFFFQEDLAGKVEVMRSTGNTMWSYACAGHAKHLSPLGYYRGQSWLAWGQGLKGIGFWSYCTTRDEPWYSAKANAEHTFSYPGNGVVTSKRWEAIRDGIEDYSMLSALREAAESAAARGVAPDAVREAEDLLEKRAAALAGFPNETAPGVNPGITGFDDFRLLVDTQWKMIESIRRDVARLLDELTQH